MIGKNARADYQDKIAAAPAEAALYRLLAVQCPPGHLASMYLKAAEGPLREAERCRKLLARN